MRLPRAPSVGRRLASALYDLLLTVALVVAATFPFLAVFGADATQGWRRHLLQLWVIAVAGAYYVWFWTRGGQTLPMKTWRLKLVRDDGGPVGVGRALHRYAIALFGTLALGTGFLWAFYDREGQFLHDRLSGTALVPAA